METQRKSKKKPGRAPAGRRMKIAESVQPESRRGAFLPTLEMITDNMSDMIRVTDLQGVNLYASPSHERILGYKPEERVGKLAFDILHPDDMDRIVYLFADSLVSQKPVRTEYRVRHAEGYYVWLDTVGDLLRDGRGEAVAVILSSRDITDRKRAEEARRETEERYRDLVERASDIVFRTDNTGHFTFVNQAALRITGYEQKEMIGAHYLIFIRPDIRDEASRFFGRQFVKRIPNTYYEYPMIAKDGRDIWIGENTQLVVQDGEVVAFQSVARDITDRKKMEMALRESENRFYSLFQQMNSGIAVYEAVENGTDFIFRDFNRAAERMDGIGKEALLGKRMTEVFPGVQDFGLLSVFQRVCHTGRPEDHDITFYRDTRITGWRKNHVYKLPSGEIVAIYEDVTEQKQAEEMLRESETKLQAIFDTVGTGILIIDQDSQIILEANRTAMEIIGWPKERIVGRICHALVCTADKGKCPIKDLGQSIDESERKLLCADGQMKDILKTVHPMTLQGRNCYVESFIDISERKRIEAALQQQEIKMSSIFRAAPVGIGMVIERVIQEVNDMLCSMTGYSRRELLGQNARMLYPNQEDYDYVGKEKYRQISEKNTGMVETRWRKKDGTVIDIILSSTQIDPDHPEKGVTFAVLDITDRKRTEEALKDSEHKYRLVVENAGESILIAQDGMLKYANPITSDILGYSIEELISKPFIEFIHPDDRQKMRAAHIGRMKGEEPQPVRQFKVICKDGSVRWADSSAVPIEWMEKPATLNFMTDITKRKKAEEELDKSFARLRDTLEATVRAIAVTVETRDPYTAGHQRRVADLSRAIAKEMGLTADQIEGVHMAGLIHDLGKIAVPTEILSKPARLTELEFELIKTHALAGHEILKDIGFPWPIARMILEHHERMDGSGYPGGLAGDCLLLESRILSVADVVESMASHRPYRPAIGFESALHEIEKNRGILYDDAVVDACLRLIREKRFHFQETPS